MELDEENELDVYTVGNQKLSSNSFDSKEKTNKTLDKSNKKQYRRKNMINQKNCLPLFAKKISQ